MVTSILDFKILYNTKCKSIYYNAMMHLWFKNKIVRYTNWIMNNKTTYGHPWTPFWMRYLLCHQRDSIWASYSPLHQQQLDLSWNRYSMITTLAMNTKQLEPGWTPKNFDKNMCSSYTNYIWVGFIIVLCYILFFILYYGNYKLNCTI